MSHITDLKALCSQMEAFGNWRYDLVVSQDNKNYFVISLDNKMMAFIPADENPIIAGHLGKYLATFTPRMISTILSLIPEELNGEV